MPKHLIRNFFVLILAIIILSQPDSSSQAAPSAAYTSIRFAVIGDYGLAGKPEAAVASLIKSWSPDFIVTTGDNNYNSGSASSIDENIGQYFGEFIHPYLGKYGSGAVENRFFPVLGNHDWDTPKAQPYLDYFTLPGNERYYDFTRGPVHFFMLDSDSREPDGISATSIQGQWLKNKLSASESPWQIVTLHHAPYSSGKHGSSTKLQWPFAAYGADAVLSGHDHSYERILRDGIPYFVNGLGGGPIYDFGTPITGSKVRYNNNYGAMLVDASETQITFQFIARDGTVIDIHTIAWPFSDVPDYHWANAWIKRLYDSGITGGCSTTPPNYCPEQSVTRAQMAIFLLKARHGQSYQPPAASGTIFSDIPADYWAASWVEQLAAERITSGCDSQNYCPDNPITRSEMAVLLMRTQNSDGYVPPAATGSVFDDVEPAHWAAGWIEELSAKGITGGCAVDLYCPNKPVTRAEMAVFLLRTFNLP